LDAGRDIKAATNFGLPPAAAIYPLIVPMGTPPVCPQPRFYKDVTGCPFRIKEAALLRLRIPF